MSRVTVGLALGAAAVIYAGTEVWRSSTSYSNNLGDYHAEGIEATFGRWHFQFTWGRYR